MKRMLTQEQVAAAVAADPSSDDWRPAWWGDDESNAKEAAAFNSWSRSLRPVT